MLLCLDGLSLFDKAQDHCTQHTAHSQRHTVQHGVIHHREYEDATVGCAQCAAEGHGERTGDRRADNAAGQDAQRVGCCIRNSALGHEAQTHDVVHNAVAALHLRGQKVVDRAMAMGGTMPPTMTAAITS